MTSNKWVYLFNDVENQVGDVIHGIGAVWLITVPWLLALTYGAIAGSPEMGTRLRSLYDGEVAENDHHFGRLVEGNDIDGTASLIDQVGDGLAGIIVEPILGAGVSAVAALTA